MYLVILYLISFVVWGLIAYELATVIRYNITHKTKLPRLLLPLFVSSIALIIDGSYFLVANIVKLAYGIDTYLYFMDEQYLFLVKILMAVSGVIILLGIKKNKE
jgi:hypothetical protein